MMMIGTSSRAEDSAMVMTRLIEVEEVGLMIPIPVSDHRVTTLRRHQSRQIRIIENPA